MFGYSVYQISTPIVKWFGYCGLPNFGEEMKMLTAQKARNKLTSSCFIFNKTSTWPFCEVK